jgi:tetratricopeptide (TPR) repeat protein
MLTAIVPRVVRYRPLFRRSFFALLLLSMLAAGAWTQTMTRSDEVLRDRISANRQEIDTAARSHATDDQLGVLWLRLANDYADGFDIQRAEEAYAHALRLLRDSSTQSYYAAALDGLGSLYLAADRWKESERCQAKALAIYEGLGNETGALRVRTGLAITFLHEHRWAESEAESAKALTSLQEQPAPDASDLVAGLIANSYAKCFQDRCAEGLAAASEAMRIARAGFAKDSAAVMSSLLAVGFAEWKTGAEREGERAMREALDLVREKTDMPRAVLVEAQLRVLTNYTNYLKAAHQKAKAKQMEEEIARLRGEQTPFCKDCTVNALALSAH